MKVLVAGGAGFIGSHLIDALIAKGDDVVCVDNFYIGNRDNIRHMDNSNSFKFYQEDLCNLSTLDRIFNDEKFDMVYHLAANSDIQASAKNPAIEYNYTLTTTYNILDCMRNYDVKKLFFSSTSAVYGDKIDGKMNEFSAPLAPISYYGGAKLSSEALISSFAHMNDLWVLIFRFPNVIGSRLTHGVVFDFIKKLRDDPCHLTILGDGTQSKPYMHVDDLVRGIIDLGYNLKPGVETYNIGVNSKTEVRVIADIIVEEMGLKDVEYIYTGGNIGWKGDVPTFEYDLKKIHSTGWKSKYSSDEAVRKTVKEVLSCRL